MDFYNFIPNPYVYYLKLIDFFDKVKERLEKNNFLLQLVHLDILLFIYTTNIIILILFKNFIFY